MISDATINTLSTLHTLEPAIVKAVRDVESKNSGFINATEPMILFEPHIFWDQLQRAGKFPKDYMITVAAKDRSGKSIPGGIRKVNPAYEDILYERWTPGKYGPYSKQHERLQRAARIDRDCALRSASWGAFQIMGFNWSLTNSQSLQDFITRMYKNEDEHLIMFFEFCVNKKLLPLLREKNFAKFAEIYNGKLYYVHGYDKRLLDTYNKYKS